MLAGSMESSFHGEPRSTQDIDLVIDPDSGSLTRFVEVSISGASMSATLRSPFGTAASST